MLVKSKVRTRQTPAVLDKTLFRCSITPPGPKNNVIYCSKKQQQKYSSRNHIDRTTFQTAEIVQH